MRRYWIWILILLLVVYCGERKREPVRNVVLVTLDTLRADHLGCYGYAKAQTPNIDRFAEQGVLFTQATAVTPLTLPSHSSILTGTYPLSHGVRDNGGYYLDEKWVTLAEAMKAGGFRTGGFISAFVLDRRWGISQGFDEYFDNFELSKFKVVSLDSVQRRGDETMEHALKWIDQNKTSRFFAWIHLYDPHTPYDPPEPFRTEFQGTPFTLYDGEIAFTDNLVGRLKDYLEKNNLLNTTLVVLTGDHGESLGEHQESGHGFFIYDATTHVPLIIHSPGDPAGKVTEQVRSIDLFPTICQAAGVAVPSAVEGVSLMPLIQGKSLPQKLTAYSESYYPRFHYGWSELKALRTPEYKYVDAPDREFYRLSEDLRERNNLYSGETSRARPFEVEMGRILAAASAPLQGPGAVDEDSLEKLQALGYIGTYVAPLQDGSQGPLPDPKDKIRLYNLIKLAQGNSAEGKVDEALAQIQQVLSEDSRILEAHLVMGNVLTKKKDLPGARKSFQNALEVDHDFTAAIFGLAKTYKDEGNLEAAEAGFKRLTELDPRDSKAFFHLGEIALLQKRFDSAVQYMEKAVSVDPDQAPSHNRLGAALLEMKRYDPAEKEFRRALELNARIPNSHFNLALIYEAREQWKEAISEYQKELELYPEAHAAYFNLSRIYRKMGNLAEERRQLEICVRENPKFGIAYLYLGKNLMDTGDDFQKAKDLVEQGITQTEDRTQKAFGHYVLADLFNRLGRPDRASTELQEARKLENR